MLAVRLYWDRQWANGMNFVMNHAPGKDQSFDPLTLLPLLNRVYLAIGGIVTQYHYKQYTITIHHKTTTDNYITKLTK